MKWFSVVVFGTLCLNGVAAPVLAQQEMQQGRDFAAGRRQGGPHPLRGLREQLISRDSAEQRSSADVPAAQPAPAPRTNPEAAQNPGRERLTPEERRQLRRDINAAGREIYRRDRAD